MSDAPSRPGSNADSVRSAVETIRAARGRVRQLQRVFDRSLVPMLLVDRERNYLAANAAARLAFRLSLDELLARRIDDLTPAHMLPGLYEAWARLHRDGIVRGSSDVRFLDGSEYRFVYCALANALPGQHLIVFTPANLLGDELGITENPEEQRPPGRLSPREREVLSLIAAGASIDKIATELTLSTATVRTHIRNALHKLGASNRAHAIALAMGQGIIDAPDWTSEPGRGRAPED